MLSIVVPTYGRRVFLERALRSLARQEGAPPFEVVVVEDGADPGMEELARSLGLPLDLRVFTHARTRGRAATRNRGIAEAKGDVVVFLDGDMEVVPEFVAAHARAHARAHAESHDESHAAAHARMPARSAEAKSAVVLGRIVTAPEIPRTAFVRYIDSRGVQKISPGSAIPARYFMTGNSSVSVDLLRRAGGFDEEFDEYGGEDTEMGYRLAAHGGVLVYAPDAVSYHLDLNSVPKMAERLRRYGEAMLPILVRKAPAARTELQLDLAEPPRAGEGWKRFVLKASAFVACRPFFWRPAAALAAILPGPVRADFLFDFVRAAAYLDGYRRSLRAGGAAGKPA
jgi:glycosyltransferase involved in cell wall biosynthesis